MDYLSKYPSLFIIRKCYPNDVCRAWFFRSYRFENIHDFFDQFRKAGLFIASPIDRIYWQGDGGGHIQFLEILQRRIVIFAPIFEHEKRLILACRDE